MTGALLWFNQRPARAEVLVVVAEFAVVAMRWSPIASLVAALRSPTMASAAESSNAPGHQLAEDSLPKAESPDRPGSGRSDAKRRGDRTK